MRMPQDADHERELAREQEDEDREREWLEGACEDEQAMDDDDATGFKSDNVPPDEEG